MSSEVLKRGKAYRSCVTFGAMSGLPAWFVWDGEPPRPPRKGEYYLSGAIIGVYQAPIDLRTSYHIAVPRDDPPRRIRHGGFWYRLDGDQHDTD